MSEQQQTLSLQQAIDLAVQHHSAGRLSEAENIYQQILQTDPNQFDALHLLGVITQQVGRNDKAVDLITKALTIKPGNARAHCNLGLALMELGKLDEAIASYRKALDFNPDFAEAHRDLGNVLKALDKPEEALASYRKALDLKPEYAEAHNNAGVALQELGKFEEAVASYHKAIDLKPDYSEAHNNLGTALRELGKLEEAAGSYGKALELKPDYAIAHNNLGVALKDLGKLDDAVTSHRKALAAKDDYIEAHKNLISSLKALGKISEQQQLKNDKTFSKRLDFFYSYLQTLGVLDSKAEEVVNGRREEIPLLTNSFLHWFETINWSDMSLLELGSGNSTVYFSRFFKLLTSYESNEKWYKSLKQKLPKNVNYVYAKPIRSALQDEDPERYDVILVDAPENRAKLSRIIKNWNYSGLIFFDNSEWYRESIGIFSELGFAEIPFFGTKPTLDWVSCTSVLTRSDNLFNWFTSDWSRLPDLARSTNNSPWDNEDSNE